MTSIHLRKASSLFCRSRKSHEFAFFACFLFFYFFGCHSYLKHRPTTMLWLSQKIYVLYARAIVWNAVNNPTCKQMGSVFSFSLLAWPLKFVTRYIFIFIFCLFGWFLLFGSLCACFFSDSAFWVTEHINAESYKLFWYHRSITHIIYIYSHKTKSSKLSGLCYTTQSFRFLSLHFLFCMKL